MKRWGKTPLISADCESSFAWSVVIRLAYRCINTTQTASAIEIQMVSMIQNV
jgi:hypothetical protein